MQEEYFGHVGEEDIRTVGSCEDMEVEDEGTMTSKELGPRCDALYYNDEILEDNSHIEETDLYIPAALRY